MVAPERTTDLHPQDWIIIIEALAQWAGPPDRLDTPRRERAYDLIELIAAEQGHSATEMLRQAYPKFGGTSN